MRLSDFGLLDVTTIHLSLPSIVKITEVAASTLVT